MTDTASKQNIFYEPEYNDTGLLKFPTDFVHFLGASWNWCIEYGEDTEN